MDDAGNGSWELAGGRLAAADTRDGVTADIRLNTSVVPARRDHSAPAIVGVV